MTDEQTSRFVAAVNAAVAETGLTPSDAAALLAGCYTEAACAAWGAHAAADQTYMLSLQLARRAGLTAVTEISKPTATH